MQSTMPLTSPPWKMTAYSIILIGTMRFGSAPIRGLLRLILILGQIAAYAGETAAHIDQETHKSLFWTINKRVLVCMLGTYFCQSLDKGTLGFASVMNIKQDANLQGQDYR